MNGDGPGSKVSGLVHKRLRPESRNDKANDSHPGVSERQQPAQPARQLALSEVLEGVLLDRMQSRGCPALDTYSEPLVRMNLMAIVEEMLRAHDTVRLHCSDFQVDDIEYIGAEEVADVLSDLAMGIEMHYSERQMTSDEILSSPRMLRNAKLLVGAFVHRLATGRSHPSYFDEFRAPIMRHVTHWTPELRNRFEATVAVMKDEFVNMGTAWTPSLEKSVWDSLVSQHKSAERNERMMLLDQLRNAMAMKGNWTMSARPLEPDIV